MFDPPDYLKSVKSRTDTNIDDEAVGVARTTYREAAESRRAEENARIAHENHEHRQRLLAIKPSTDDGDGIGVGNNTEWLEATRQRVEQYAQFRQQAASAYLDRAWEAHAVHRHKLANMQSSIDDDTEDDATGEARAKLRAQSAARREVEAEALRMRNLQMRARINSIQAKTDSKVWDDGEGSAGAMRVVVARESKARRKAEAQSLAMSNKEHQRRVANATAATDDGDGTQN